MKFYLLYWILLFYKINYFVLFLVLVYIFFFLKIYDSEVWWCLGVDVSLFNVLFKVSLWVVNLLGVYLIKVIEIVDCLVSVFILCIKLYIYFLWVGVMGLEKG